MAISITPAPTLPSLSSPSTFNTRALALHAWMVGDFINDLEGITAGDILTDLNGRMLAIQKFTASGTYTPTAGTKWAIVEIQPAGGGGGNGNSTTGEVGAANGGSAGNYVRALIDVSGIGTATLTLGAAGAGATTASGNGAAGGDTTWADGTTTIVARGGNGGTGMSSQAASLGGTTNTVNTANSITAGANHVLTLADVLGEIAVPGFCIGTDVAFPSNGASSRFGSGGRSIPRNVSGSNVGNNATGYGAGGGGGASKGAVTGGSNGGNGTGALVEITEFSDV